MNTLLIATHNLKKAEEIREILSDSGWMFVTLDSVGITRDVAETGNTFEENALLKAKAYGEQSGLVTLADDSGLEVDALGGKPGIYSARYVQGSDEDRVKKVLEELQDVPEEKRSARFVAVMALYNPKTKKHFICKGECSGRIIHAPRGNNGFGYDPIFFSPELGKTFAEAAGNEKAKISHRGRALIQCRNFLQNGNAF